MLNAEGRCPICGNWEDIIESAGEYNPDYDLVEFHCRCPHCDIEWDTVYSLAYDGFQIGNTWIDKDGAPSQTN